MVDRVEMRRRGVGIDRIARQIGLCSEQAEPKRFLRETNLESWRYQQHRIGSRPVEEYPIAQRPLPASGRSSS